MNAPEPARILTVLSRSWCHLCEDLITALEPVAVSLGWRVEVVDVDQFPELVEKWDELVPVVLHGEIKLCHYHLDEVFIRAYCAGFPLKSDV